MAKDITKAFEALRAVQVEIASSNKNDAENFWESLSYEDKLNAFYAVCSRIYKAEIEDHGSYRYALYSVFGFGMDAYGLGMECGYMDIHNSIVDEELRDIFAELTKRIK